MPTRSAMAALAVVLLSSTVSSVGHALAAAPSPTALGARAVYNGMTTAQRIGQLFMVGTPATGLADVTRTAITRYHVGNVILTGRSSNGVAATRSLTNSIQGLASASATSNVGLFVSSDQEGGQVQVLSGSGFAAIPSGLTQGTWTPTTLQSSAHTWGGQLAAAGVDVDLAPVLDTVPIGRDNPPIGGYDREYGHTPDVVSAHGTAFARGLAQAGVLATIKHFPGLGRVTANTDTTAGVTDHETTATDPYLHPFRDAIRTGVPMVMMSTAYYSRIDASHPAAFSSTIVTGLLRRTLEFRGVVVSDDLGNAAQVAAWTPGERAVDFLAAGGDIVLTVNPAKIPEMTAAVASRVARDEQFANQVRASVLRVLLLKQARGLLRRPALADFTADGRSDRTVYRPSDHTWRTEGVLPVVYGIDGDRPVPADYTGSGRAHIAVFRPSTGTWYVRGDEIVHFGMHGDIPVPGDYRGVGADDLAVFRPSNGTWYLRGAGSVKYGAAGDRPVACDWAGNGRTDPAVFRTSIGWWYRRGLAPVHYGVAGDIPVPGDYTGDGVCDVAVFRPSTGVWYVHGLAPVHWGAASDLPVAGHDYAGDGTADLAVFRPGSGTWAVRGRAPIILGQQGDRPL